MSKPLAIDLYAGLGGWSDGCLAEGYDCIGFDIERHQYGEARYPGQLVIQDVTTLHGSQFKGAALIVASPPCQEYSWMAMPWSLAKAKAAAIRADKTGAELERLNRLFNACFRIQREACGAAGRHIPMVVENVRGAIPWVGRSRWNFGSFHLWGDVPALMPIAISSRVPTAPSLHRGDGSNLQNIIVGDGIKGAHDTSGSHWTNPAERPSVQHTGVKAPGMNWSDQSKRGQDFTRIAGQHALAGHKLRDQDGYERTHPNALGWKAPRSTSKGEGRKMASAMIAKIPLVLSRHIAATYRP